MSCIARLKPAAAFVAAALLAAPAAAVSAAPASASASSTQPQPPQEEFVPIDQVPPEDRLPAAPLLVAAYAVVWVVVFGYLWSIRRRASALDRELAELSRRAAAGGGWNPEERA